ncbi:MAG: hypothetical protein M3Z05_02285 [Gemmatimonadota bacterium]|nr:hypothetical protein [Gemmatimonadota bacterium]
MVWFTGNANGRIVKLDPATGKLTTLMMPDPAVRDPHTMTFDRKGDAWFTAQGAGVIGRLTQEDGKIRLWKPRRIAITPDDVIWYGDYTRGFLGRLDPLSGKTEEFALPAGDGSLPYGMTVDDRRRIWLARQARSRIGWWRSIRRRGRSRRK